MPMWAAQHVADHVVAAALRGGGEPGRDLVSALPGVALPCKEPPGRGSTEQPGLCLELF
jgi:hypothetical protein